MMKKIYIEVITKDETTRINQKDLPASPEQAAFDIKKYFKERAKVILHEPMGSRELLAVFSKDTRYGKMAVFSKDTGKWEGLVDTGKGEGLVDTGKWDLKPYFQNLVDNIEHQLGRRQNELRSHLNVYLRAEKRKRKKRGSPSPSPKEPSLLQLPPPMKACRCVCK